YEQLAKAKAAAAYLDSIRSNSNAGSSTIENLANEFERSKQSLAQRIDAKFIIEQLQEELQIRNIPLDFEWKINKGQTDSILFQQASQLPRQVVSNQYSTVLFPNEVRGNEAIISIYFPNKTAILMGNAKIML